MAPIPINGESYLTAVEAAIRIGCCDETIRRWVRLGRLPARKFGFQLFILEKDVEVAIAKKELLQKEAVTQSLVNHPGIA
ncbi:hypothetical protein ES703_00475 [subsurface metagenome]